MFYIHKHAIRLNYGGPEEGGWHFKSGEPVQDWPIEEFADEEEAFARCRELNSAERERREKEEDYEFTSVLAYKSDHFEYDVSDSPELYSFPKERPRYE